MLNQKSRVFSSEVAPVRVKKTRQNKKLASSQSGRDIGGGRVRGVEIIARFVAGTWYRRRQPLRQAEYDVIFDGDIGLGRRIAERGRCRRRGRLRWLGLRLLATGTCGLLLRRRVLGLRGRLRERSRLGRFPV